MAGKKVTTWSSKKSGNM